MFEYVFMRHAFAAGVLVSVMLSLLGFFVVLRRMSFIGVGISHTAFGGASLGYLIGTYILISSGYSPTTDHVRFQEALDPFVFTTAVIFSLATALGIGAVSRKGKLREDTAIGIFFAVGMALGGFFLHLVKGYTVDLLSFLFGSIVLVSKVDLWMIAGVGVVIFIFLVLFFKGFLATSFDAEMARVSGMPEAFFSYLLLGLVALGIVAAIKIAGIVLVAALLVLPAATALQWSRRYRRVLWLSIFFGVGSTVGGLTVSYWMDFPSGITIVLLGTVVFLGSLLFSPLRRHRIADFKKRA